ncbi:hypothetical protein [Kribbella capetownensis]|nr:hypothetical protein [Kribbella capetownensis]
MDELQEENPGWTQAAGRGSLAGRIVLADDWDSAETSQAIAEDFDRLT